MILGSFQAAFWQIIQICPATALCALSLQRNAVGLPAIIARGTLVDPEIRPAALETIRGLISAVTIHENDQGARVTLDGAITALVGLAQPEAEAFINNGSVKVVAGGRNRRNLPRLACAI
jgi:hypothetical protein